MERRYLLPKKVTCNGKDVTNNALLVYSAVM